VTRIYRSPEDLEATCDRLQAHFQDRSPTIARHKRGCTVGFRVSAGWGAQSVIVSASAATSRLHANEPREPYTRVVVSLVDQ
jgi:hypothetical protein